jgi:hypothetical protein
MSYFKSLLLMLCIANCGLSSSSGNNNNQNLTPEQKVRRSLSEQTWGTTCLNNGHSRFIVGEYHFVYFSQYNTATSEVTYFPLADNTCSGVPSYALTVGTGHFTFGHVDGETDTSDDISTKFGTAKKLNYSISSVTIIPYDTDGISLATSCGVSSPSLNTAYDISGCLAVNVPTTGSTAYTLLYVDDAVTTFTIEVGGTNYSSPNSRPTDFSFQAPGFLIYTF